MASCSTDSQLVYVGNLPSGITDEEIQEIFSEIPGVKLKNVVCKGLKKFCFLICDDEKTVSDVVNSRNRYSVMGRKLVVRASDSNSRNANPWNGARYPNRGSRFNRERGNPDDRTPQSSPSESSKPISDFEYQREHNTCTAPQENSELSNSAADKNDQCGLLCVQNFPYGVTERELLYLFDEYEPLEALIECNEPGEGLVTQAYVLVPSPKHALDAVINLDNTIYRRRTLLVSEVDAFEIVPELMTLQRTFSKVQLEDGHECGSGKYQ